MKTFIDCILQKPKQPKNVPWKSNGKNGKADHDEGENKMGGSMSRSKGQRAEREVIKLLQPVVNEVWQQVFGDKVGGEWEIPKLQRNTLQSDEGGFDIVGLQWMALEVKHQEKLQVEKWWEQTVRQAKGKAEPILMYKQNNVKFRVRVWVPIWVHGYGEHINEVVEMSLESFIRYLRKRLESELRRSI